MRSAIRRQDLFGGGARDRAKRMGRLRGARQLRAAAGLLEIAGVYPEQGEVSFKRGANRGAICAKLGGVQAHENGSSKPDRHP